MSVFLYNTMLKLDSIPTTVDGGIHLENINIGVMAAVLGIIIVFLVLIAIFLLLAIFSMLVKDKKKQEVQQSVMPQPIPANPVVPVKTAPAPVAENYIDDKELVAVISAAIAATMGTSTDGLVVRRIRRVGNWNQEAI